MNYLDELYPNPKCELNYNKDYELLIAVVLSAQTTDKRVNKVTEVLFKKYDTLKKLKNANIKDIEDIIEKNIRENDVKYVFHDYVHTSLKILEEISSRSGGIKLREDNVLFMLSVKLKDIANKHGVFILSAT